MLEGAAGHAAALLTRAARSTVASQSVAQRVGRACRDPVGERHEPRSPPAARSRRTASRVSAEPPEADTATTIVPDATTGSRSEAASSATAGTPRARSRAAATWFA